MRALFILLALTAMAAIPAAAVAQQAAPAGKSRAAAKPANPAAGSTAIINLNTATQAQLESLPGVGPKAAERILEYRQKNGQFKKVEEILETSRSCPYLLTVLTSWPPRRSPEVAKSLSKSPDYSRAVGALVGALL